MIRFPFVLLMAAALPAAAPHWQIQYFHDVDSSSFTITDLHFPSPDRGMAFGFLTEDRNTKPAGLLTADGGKTWSEVKLPEIPSSAFFLNEKIGWMVGKGRVFQTTDSARTWSKLGRASDALRVYFLDESHGWAVGNRKSIYETHNGGRKWNKLSAADLPKTSRDQTVYATIAFAGPKTGLIAGWNKPPRRGDRRRVPDWMDPEERRREWPGTGILLFTTDGGATWQLQETSMFGEITRVRLTPDGRGLMLIEFLDQFEYPAEVMRFDLRGGRTTRVFRESKRVVTDIALPASGPAYIAAVEPEGELPRTPVPGKLRILRSADLVKWQEMPVDYRAVARRAVLAGPDAGHLWVATDTGMILRLESE